MKIYANLDELIPHLGEIDGWLYVDEDRWAQNPAAAEIYLFAEEEAKYWDTHDGEYFDDARPPYIPAQPADRPSASCWKAARFTMCCGTWPNTFPTTRPNSSHMQCRSIKRTTHPTKPAV